MSVKRKVTVPVGRSCTAPMIACGPPACHFLDTTNVRVPKMHDDEVDTDTSLVRRLVAAQFPRWADLPIQPVLFGGTDNALYRLGDDLVVRLPRHERTVGTLRAGAPMAAEARPVPAARGSGAGGRGRAGQRLSVDVVDLPWLEGETATSERVADLRTAATDLARVRHRLTAHRCDGRAAAEQAQRLSRRAAGHPGREHACVDRRPGLDDRRRSGDGNLGSRPSRSGVGRSVVWIHGDLDARNLLAKDGRISAVIDWGCSASATPLATWRSRGRCSTRTRATSSGQRSRSTTRPGRAAVAGCCPRR